MTFQGVITADIIDVRFAYAGKVVSVAKNRGDTVKKGDILATLDRRLLQTELDRQLADYEKVRAEFELFNLKSGKDEDDMTKYLKQTKQAALNASVKEVELAKFKIDQADMVSPVDGTVLDTGGLAVGLYVTPSNTPVRIIDKESLSFIFSVSQDDLRNLAAPKNVEVVIHGLDQKYTGKTLMPVWGRDGKFDTEVFLDSKDGLLPGLVGHVLVNT